MSKHVYFVITTYNQERFIKEAIYGAFSQTYSPLTILISDDCSTDNTFDIIQKEVADYTGSHHVIINRNKKNLGLANHINTIHHIIDVSGKVLIVGAAGDDISLPERTQVLYDEWEKHHFEDISLFSAMKVVAEDGCTPVEFFRMSYTDMNLTADAFAHGTFSVYGCTHAFTKGLLDTFGALHTQVIHEDAIIPFRASLLGGVFFINKVLVSYRRVEGSAWKARSQRTVLDAKKQFMRHAVGNLAVAKNQLSDFQQAVKNKSVKNAMVIESRLKEKLNGYRYEYRLADTSSQMKRLGIIAKAMWDGMPSRKVIKWLSIFFAPFLYTHVILRQVKKRPRHD